MYRWTRTVEETTYEVRALQAAGTAMPPESPHFALHECALTCSRRRGCPGGSARPGRTCASRSPLAALDAQEGSQLTEVEASTAFGEASPGALATLDDVDLADALIPASRVELGIAPPSAPQDSVSFSAQAQPVEGRFSGAVDVSARTDTAHRVWARACLGQVCGAHSVVVDL